MNFFYGFYENDPRQINVRHEIRTGGKYWITYVGGDELPGWRSSKEEAEAAAIEFLRTGRRT